MDLAFEIAHKGSKAPAYSRAEQSEGNNSNTGNTSSAIRAVLTRRFGKAIAQLEATGLLQIWDSVEQYNAAMPESRKIRQPAQGMWDGSAAHLFASSIPKGKEVGVVLHEVGEHASMQDMLGTENYQRLLDRARALLQAGDPSALEALGRIPQDTPIKDRPSELLAYLIEAGSARAEQASPGVRKWLAEIVGAIRAWWSTTGLNAQLARHGLGIELAAQDRGAG